MNRIKSAAGFSLVELMVVVGVVALMAAIVTPSLISWLPNARFREATRGMLEDVQFAKMTAVNRNVNVAAVFLADGSGYTVFVDDGGGGAGANNNTLDAGEQTLKTITMPRNVTVSSVPPGPVPALAFLPTGIPANGAALLSVSNNQTNHNATLTVTVAGSIKSH